MAALSRLLLPAAAPALRLGLAVALSLSLPCRHAGAPPRPPAKPAAAAVTDRVRLFLIAPGDAGRSGRAAGCGDSTMPVEVTLPAPAPAFAGAIRALLAKSGAVDSRSGLADPLYASSLALSSLDVQGGEAHVYLSGYLEVGDECNARRIAAQLRDTALQFEGVRGVTFSVDGKPLEELLAAASRRPESAGERAGAVAR